MSRRASVGVPIGVAAAVVAAVFGGVLLRSEGGRPPTLPLSLSASSGRSGSETAADTKMAGAPAPYGGGGATYRFVGPVPGDLPTKSDVYELEDGGPAKVDVRRLADALGLSGDITAERETYVVRDGEWVLQVSTTASRMWNFYREVKPVCEPTPEGAEPGVAEEYEKRCAQIEPGYGGGSDGAAGICLEGADSPCNDTPETTTAPPPPPAEPEKAPEPAIAPDATTSSTASSDQAVMSCPEPAPCPPDAKCAAVDCKPYEEPTPLPLGPESEARALAQKVFAAAGIGPGARIRAERGYDAWHITASSTVNGLEVVGMGHSVSVDGDGKVRDASGSMFSADVFDTYPLIDAEAGLDRLEKQYGDVRTLMLCAPEQPDCNGSTEPVVLDATGVRLGLLFSPLWENERERVLLVPAWVYEIKGRDYPESVMAIPDSYLKAVTPEQPPGQVVVDPAQPADDGDSAVGGPEEPQVDPAVEPEPRPASS
ncbi:MAG TPA: hypothetical protein VNA14_12600 [Mycobacteriales bacterium]|nr:hypothetical protein [Mycobacteriales bacterium]